MKHHYTDADREAGAILAMVADAVLNHKFNFSIEYGENPIPTKITLEIVSRIEHSD